MNQATIAVSILWAFIFAYAILGSVDFGAGFWALVYDRNKNTRAAQIANRYLSPSWEVTNVFLVLIAVALVGFFPKAAYWFGTVLIVPVSLVLILLTVRSSFMVYSYSTSRFSRILRWISGLTGVLIPGLLLSVLPISLGGFVEVTENAQPHLLFGKLLRSPTEYSHLAFGITSELFLATLFLSDYAHEADDLSTYRVYRKAAKWLGPLTLATAVLATYTMAPEAEWIVSRIGEQWPWFLASVVSFGIGYSALWWKRKAGIPGWPRFAVTFVIGQYFLASMGYGIAHLPYLLHPYVTIDEAITNPSTFRALLVSYSIGIAVLAPGFYMFWRLFLKDKKYIGKGPDAEPKA
ncbi:cytochrome d ubiquinol oxidase subunit II [Paenibacillus castaneae]|uniref:cytochrome d ubiquinol oxidase subunit II n=1 Tax=Paenibacillus castaneae TaxID=474957 RepID=UPI000C998B36|nr:cytochrome d ubiquinol oxidase subunit II [Paenibacillus castaneae]NIK77841.1 cytochrome d ubiquinol oxidase subunit II [Paenibacillus castaneae]